MKNARPFRDTAALSVAVVVAVVAFPGCGGGASDSELEQAKEQGRKEAQAQERVRQQRHQIASLQRQVRLLARKVGKPGGGAPAVAPKPSEPPSGSTSCGDGVSAGPNTSCPFAALVRDSYPGSDISFPVYSPVTGQVYSMRCSTTSPHVCTGGNNASVYFP